MSQPTTDGWTGKPCPACGGTGEGPRSNGSYSGNLACSACGGTGEEYKRELDRLLGSDPRVVAVGYCTLCNTSIWSNQSCIENGEGLRHPLCIVKARAEAAEAKISALTAMIETLLRSAQPNEPNHPTMYKAWNEAQALLDSFNQTVT